MLSAIDIGLVVVGILGVYIGGKIICIIEDKLDGIKKVILKYILLFGVVVLIVITIWVFISSFFSKYTSKSRIICSAQGNFSENDLLGEGEFQVGNQGYILFEFNISADKKKKEDSTVNAIITLSNVDIMQDY